MTPNLRSKKFYEAKGYMVATVETHSPWPKPFGKKHDMHGMFDLHALMPGGVALGVQATTQSNVNARVRKMLALPALKQWLEIGGQVVVIGWAKRGPRGGRKTWQASERFLTLADLGAEAAVADASCPILCATSILAAADEARLAR